MNSNWFFPPEKTPAYGTRRIAPPQGSLAVKVFDAEEFAGRAAAYIRAHGQKELAAANILGQTDQLSKFQAMAAVGHITHLLTGDCLKTWLQALERKTR